MRARYELIIDSITTNPVIDDACAEITAVAVICPHFGDFKAATRF